MASSVWVWPGKATASGLMVGDGSAAAPSLTFASATGQGLFLSGLGQTSYVFGGANILTFDGSATSLRLRNDATLAWSSTTSSVGALDTRLARGTAGELNIGQLEPTPPAPTVALAGAGAGLVDNGAHTYVQTCVTAGGETTYAVGNVATVADKTTNGKVTVTLKPGSPVTTSRNLYRSKAGTTTPLFLLASIADSQITQTYVDNIADASLQAGTAPTSNTAYDTHYTLPPAGAGVPRLVGYGRVEGATAAIAQLATFTPTADGSFDVSANVLVTAGTTFSFGCSVSYTDEGGTARVLPFSFEKPSGSQGNPVNTDGTIAYASFVSTIRVKANTVMLIATTGTFTTVTYNGEGFIVQKR